MTATHKQILSSFFFLKRQSPVGQGLLIHEASRSHTATRHSRVGFLWMNDQLAAETSTGQHTTLKRDKHPCLRWDWNPQSQQASGRMRMPQTTRPPGPASIVIKLNSVALVRTRTIPTERPPPVGEVSANSCGQRGVTWSAQWVPTAVNLCFLDLEPLLFSFKQLLN